MNRKLNTGRLLVKLSRLSAWMLLVFMIIFLISGYAWYNRALLPIEQAIYLHTELDLILVAFFLIHALISIRLTLARWRVGHGRLLNVLLVAAGIVFFWLVLDIR